MTQFIGEFEIKVDNKGRLLFPAGLRKQLPPDSQERFVVNRGFENCLALYPFTEWQKISTEVNKLNPYIKKNREFSRFFYRGSTELILDGSGRMLLPKRLLEFAGITKDVVMSAYSNKIEIWSGKRFNELQKNESDDFAALAEEVMGKVNSGNEG
jgi:transcriptional regulator MraZ